MTFNWKYGLAFVIIFLIEVIIAVYVHDSFIRPFFGDVLVIVLIYCFVKTFVKWTVKKAAVGVLIFAVAIEVAQFFKMAELLGLEKNKVASVVLGSTFDWLDILAYLIGTAAVIIFESKKKLLFK